MFQCDIDEILRRAEMAEDAPATVGDELLSAFKVASFAAFEEDKDTQSEQEPDEEVRDWVSGSAYKCISPSDHFRTCQYTECHNSVTDNIH